MENTEKKTIFDPVYVRSNMSSHQRTINVKTPILLSLPCCRQNNRCYHVACLCDFLLLCISKTEATIIMVLISCSNEYDCLPIIV